MTGGFVEFSGKTRRLRSERVSGCGSKDPRPNELWMTGRKEKPKTHPQKTRMGHPADGPRRGLVVAALKTRSHMSLQGERDSSLRGLRSE